MAINSSNIGQWKTDIASSVDFYNEWFLKFAPVTYRNQRALTTVKVEGALQKTNYLMGLSAEVIKSNPDILSTLRMSTCPPIARDRLVGLAYTTKSLVQTLEEGKLPGRNPDLDLHLQRIAQTINLLLDKDLFPWLETGNVPTEAEQYRASTIVADRLCGSESDPIIRNEQEKRQLAAIRTYLEARGYVMQSHPGTSPLGAMTPGTFWNRQTIVVGSAQSPVNIPVDVVIQPKSAKSGDIPILIEAKSAGDFTNVNKRRKEEAQKVNQLKAKFPSVRFYLFLCGYFDAGYLGYSAAEGMDWIWEHRISDMDKLGL